MTAKKPSSFSHYLAVASYRQASGTQLYPHHLEKPLAPGHHMLHKRTDAAPGES